MFEALTVLQEVAGFVLHKYMKSQDMEPNTPLIRGIIFQLSGEVAQIQKCSASWRRVRTWATEEEREHKDALVEGEALAKLLSKELES